MQTKIYLCLAYLVIVSGLVWTDDLPQNNSESLLISKSTKNLFKVEDDIFIIHSLFNAADAQLMQRERERISSITEAHFETAEFISSESVSKLPEIAAQQAFYQKHPMLPMKLITDNSFTQILKVPESKRGYFKAYFEELSAKSLADKTVYSGLSYLNYEIGKATESIKLYVLPSLIIISFAFLLFFLRNVFITLYLFHFSLLSIAIAQVSLKLFYEESNILSSLTPLINFVVILSLNFHLFYGFAHYQSKKVLVGKKLIPVLIMLLTTLLGLYSLSISDIPAIIQFAQMSTFSLFIASVINLIVFIFLPLKTNIKIWQPKINIEKIKLPKWLAYAFLIIPLLVGPWIFLKLPIQVEALYFFPEHNEVVSNIKFVEKNLIGTPILELRLHKIDEKISVRDYKKLEKLEQELLQILPAETKIISQIEMVKQANYIYTAEYKLPDFEVSTFALISQIPSNLKQSFNSDYYPLTILSQSLDTEDYLKLIGKIRNKLEQSEYYYQFGGLNYSLMNSQKNLLQTLANSFFMGLLVVSLIVGFSFRSLGDFFIFVLVNLCPPLMTIIAFYLFGLSLNVATIMTFSVSFGIIVDATIHLLHASKEKFHHDELNQAIYMPVLISSLILILGFCCFIPHYFLPISQFGASMTLTIFFGAIYDLYVLPRIKN
ncbi:MAG: hypothetical protein JNM93_04775 [Bacteriovoracaceae bacterium]|nr:hypothetical protein [Bacteriovoracaceae bacterium]